MTTVQERLPTLDPPRDGTVSVLVQQVESDLQTFDFDVAIVGLGYVGLPTALAFHAAGKTVVGLDLSAPRVNSIKTRRVDLLASDQERLASALGDSKRFLLSLDPADLQRARAVLVCVPTPVDEHLVPDLEALRAACRTVVAYARKGQVLMLTSTTYVGSTRDFMVTPLLNRGLAAGRDVYVAFSPERIDPGNDGHAQEEVPRIVGGVTDSCATHAASVLRQYASRLHLVSSAEAAEMTKLYENTFRAVNIALANEIADISAVLGLNVWEVIDAAATKPYGFMPFYPGPGVGGHCIPCDPHYLLWQLRRSRTVAPLIETAMTAVATRPARVYQRSLEILAAAGRPMAGARVLVVGVAYKPGVSDVRESPALELIDRFRQAGAEVQYEDSRIPSIQTSSGRMESLASASSEQWDLVLLHTMHPEYATAWIERDTRVLDATYRVHQIPWRQVV